MQDDTEEQIPEFEDTAEAEPASQPSLDIEPSVEPAPAVTETPHQRQRREQLELEARYAREDAERWRQQAEQLSRQNQPPQYNPATDPNLDPEQRIMAAVEQSNRMYQQGQVATVVHFSGELDRQKFEGELAKRPADRKYAEAVEREYQQHVQILTNAGRPDLIQSRMRFLNEKRGQDVATRGERAVEQARRSAQTEVSRHQTRPAPVRSNVSRSSSPSETPAEAARRRLREAYPEAGY